VLCTSKYCIAEFIVLLDHTIHLLKMVHLNSQYHLLKSIQTNLQPWDLCPRCFIQMVSVLCYIHMCSWYDHSELLVQYFLLLLQLVHLVFLLHIKFQLQYHASVWCSDSFAVADIAVESITHYGDCNWLLKPVCAWQKETKVMADIIAVLQCNTCFKMVWWTDVIKWKFT